MKTQLLKPARERASYTKEELSAGGAGAVAFQWPQRDEGCKRNLGHSPPLHLYRWATLGA